MLQSAEAEENIRVYHKNNVIFHLDILKFEVYYTPEHHAVQSCINCCLPLAFACLNTSTMRMEAVRSSEISVNFYLMTRPHIPRESTLQSPPSGPQITELN
jgi:hypothetical protein